MLRSPPSVGQTPFALERWGGWKVNHSRAEELRHDLESCDVDLVVEARERPEVLANVAGSQKRRICFLSSVGREGRGFEGEVVAEMRGVGWGGWRKEMAC